MKNQSTSDRLYGLVAITQGGVFFDFRLRRGRGEGLMAAPTVALELYTVRDELERDFAGTLRRVAAMGYPAVEGGHYRTIETGAMKALLDETGLQVPAVLFGLPALEADLDAEIDYCRTIGSSYLVLSWVHPAQLAGDVLPALARRLNE